MTTQELIQKLEECRSNLENSKDEMAQDTFNTLNQLIYDLENDGISGNEYWSKHRSYH